MPAYESFLLLHILAGTLALLAFWSAAWLRKGSAAHRRVGQVYLAAMAVVVLTGVPLIAQAVIKGQLVAAVFLTYLFVITATGVWSAWRAVRDRHDVARYTGPVYLAFAGLSILSGMAVLAVGLRVGAPLLIGFSAVGILAGAAMLRKRARRDRLAAHPGWWRVEHYTAMLGNGVATHIAFLSIGLPRLLPMVDGTTLHYTSWFGPLLVATIAKVMLDRRFKPRASRPVRVPEPA